MKYYSIDEDVFRALLDMVREQALISKMESDREAIMFYDFIIDQMLDADEFDTTAPKYKRPDDKIRLDKIRWNKIRYDLRQVKTRQDKIG